MKIGILGAGNIAGTMAVTLNGMKDAQGYAVAARELSRATEFAKTYGIEKAYGSYEELVSDEEVELIYIATPHSHHFEHMKLCIEHNKPVLCEKAFTRNAKEAKEIFTLAAEKKVFVTEAIWTRYQPMRDTINQVMNSGIIGEIKSLQANLGYPVGDKERMFEPKLAGGVLLDIGVYPLNFASMVFGDKIKRIDSSAILTDKGVDALNSITILFEDSKMAVLHSTMYSPTDRRGIIYGSKGYMEIKNINNCEGILVYDTNHQLIAEYKTPEQITGYEYEVWASMEAIAAGKLECEQMPHDETVRIMELMDSLRKEWGVVYPGE